MNLKSLLLIFFLFFSFQNAFAQVIDDEKIDDAVIDAKTKEKNQKIKEPKKSFKVDNIFVGTTFSLIFGNYLFIDISPYGGYLFGKYLGVGVGATYIYYGDIMTGRYDHIYGARVFANLRPFPDMKGLNGLYAHLEGEYLDHTVGTGKREGVPALNLGFGYNTAFDKGFAFTAELFVNALWFGQVQQGILPVYNSPWQYRIGVYYAF